MPNRPTADRFHAPPERSSDFAHLSLDGLRQYRTTLSSEESRVSYWRRIIQARLDVVRATDTGSANTLDDLRNMFSENRATGSRNALITIVPMDDLPPLPDLGAIWAREPAPGDDDHNAKLIHDLSKAESQLSAYRTALHRRLASATTELIARYREEPDLCLSALPSPTNPARTAAQ
jgi:anti-sigma-K factor RsiG